MTQQITKQIKEKAFKIGFDLVGISGIDNKENYNHYERWINKNFNGQMEYMNRNKEKRKNIKLIIPSAQSVISLAVNYYIEPDTNTDAYISTYSRNIDYHIVMGKMIKKLIKFIKEKEPDAELRYYVDTGPILERAYAEQAGIGWIGKNTCLINRKLGSFIFLAEVITNLYLEEDTKAKNYCGKCTKCIDLCPTNAIIAPYTLDSRLCIAYLNIELKDTIPTKLRDKIDNNLFGCDICQIVCPWNKKVITNKKIELLNKKEIEEKSLADFLTINEEDFKATFKQNPIKRLKWIFFLRNAVIVAGNSFKYKYISTLEKLKKINNHLLNEHIDWAINRITKNKKKN